MLYIKILDTQYLEEKKKNDGGSLSKKKKKKKISNRIKGEAKKTRREKSRFSIPKTHALPSGCTHLHNFGSAGIVLFHFSFWVFNDRLEARNLLTRK